MLSIKRISESIVIPKESTIGVLYLADTSSNDITVELPSSEDCVGRTIFLKKLEAAGTLTFDAEGSDMIGAKASYSATDQYSMMGLVSVGTNNWQVLASNGFA